LDSLAVLRLGMEEGAAGLGVQGDAGLVVIKVFSVSDPLSSDSNI